MIVAAKVRFCERKAIASRSLILIANDVAIIPAGSENNAIPITIPTPVIPLPI